MHLFRNCGLACSAVPGGGCVGVIQLPHERISERRIELEYGPRISWRLARADHSQGEIDDAEDGVGSPPAEAAPAVPAEQSSLVAFAAVGAGTTGYCQPLDIATMRVFKLKQILHHVMTILWKTVVCTRLRPGRQLSARAVSVLPDLDGEPPLFFSTAGQHPHGFRPFSCFFKCFVPARRFDLSTVCRKTHPET